MKKSLSDYNFDIEMLKLHLKNTSPKDDDIKAEIREEIADLERWRDKDYPHYQ